MKAFQKSVGVALVLVLALTLLAGCGKIPPTESDAPGYDSDLWQAIEDELLEDETETPTPDQSDNGDAGYYVIDSMIIDGELYDSQALAEKQIYYYIRLNEDNTAQISTDVQVSGTWEYGELHYQENGEDVISKYELNNDTMTIEIADEFSEATLVFRRSNESSAQIKWNGLWYGYMWVSEAYGIYGQDEAEEDYYNDAYMYIEVDEGGEGTLQIILDGDDENTVEATIQADEEYLQTTEGFFWDVPLDSSAWWLSLSPMSEGKEIIISNAFVASGDDGEGGFDYMFCFHPYGELWELEEREGYMLPPGYEMYKNELSLTDSTADMDADADSAGAIEAAPHFTSAELKEIYNELSQAYDSFELGELDYDEVCNKFFDSVDGMLEGNESTAFIRKWYATDNAETYVYVSFRDNGDESSTADGIGSYLP